MDESFSVWSKRIWRHRILVAAVAAVAAAAGFGAAQLQEVQYEATAELLLADPREAGLFQELGPQSLDPGRYARNQARQMTSTRVLDQVRSRLGIPLSIADLRERVTTEVAADLDLVQIHARSGTPAGAATLADAVADAYQALMLAQVQAGAEEAVGELRDAIAELQRTISRADATLAAEPGDATAQAQRDAAIAQLTINQGLIDRITVDAALYRSGVDVFEPALAPDRPVQPRTAANTVIAAILGLLGGGWFAAWFGRRSERADRPSDPARILGVPLLGTVPAFGSVAGVSKDDPVPSATAPESAVAESFRFVAAALEHRLGRGGARTIVVTSPRSGDGKTTTAANLALVGKRSKGERLLLVDADIRVRSLTRLAGLDQHAGLSDLAVPGLPVSGCVASWDVGGDAALSLVPVGAHEVDPATFFREPGFRRALQRLREWADTVYLDTPPLLAVSDTSAIASQADGIVLVVDRGTPLRVLESVADRLQFVGAPLLGYVYNRAVDRRGGYGYGYGYGEGSGGDAQRTGGIRSRRQGKPPAEAGSVATREARWSAL